MARSTRTDVLIIGGGPAGLSAATWCSDLGLSATLTEREADTGGQLNSIHGPIENYMARRAKNGREMAAYFRETADRFDFVQLVQTNVTRIDLSSMSALLHDGREIGFAALILATGVRRRQLGIPGEKEFVGKGILESGVRDRDLAAGKRVVIVGGGDAAAENALLLAELAASVTVVHRRNEFRARSEFLERMYARDGVGVLRETVVKRIVGDGIVTGVEIENVSTGETRSLAADVVLIRIGVEPNSELVRDIVDLDEQGYVKVDTSCETTVRGVFAVGDVANPAAHDKHRHGHRSLCRAVRI